MCILVNTNWTDLFKMADLFIKTKQASFKANVEYI